MQECKLYIIAVVALRTIMRRAAIRMTTSRAATPVKAFNECAAHGAKAAARLACSNVPLDARELQELPEQASEVAVSKQCAAKVYGCSKCTGPPDVSQCKKCLSPTSGDATVSPPVPDVSWTASPVEGSGRVTCGRCKILDLVK
eukprot:4524-Heterococcus_DN1.PRE.3